MTSMVQEAIDALKDLPEDPQATIVVDAALHILAAWVASSQAKSTTAEREADIEELEELLPLYIDYHRAAKWLPDPHRADN
jgi:hypothetical protein